MSMTPFEFGQLIGSIEKQAGWQNMLFGGGNMKLLQQTAGTIGSGVANMGTGMIRSGRKALTAAAPPALSGAKALNFSRGIAGEAFRDPKLLGAGAGHFAPVYREAVKGRVLQAVGKPLHQAGKFVAGFGG